MIITILCLMGLGLLPRVLPGSSGGSRMVVIRVGNEIYQKVPLQAASDETIEVKTPGGGVNLVRIREGKVSVISSNCPEQICVRSAPISKPGQTIACLPHRLVISIEGGPDAEQNGVDGFSY